MEFEKLWEKYKKSKLGQEQDIIAARNDIIVFYLDLIRAIAKKQSIKIRNRFSADELIGYGVEGMIKAIEKYDETLNVRFSTFARYRISGEILDFLRSNDFVPRTVRDRHRHINRFASGGNILEDDIEGAGYDYNDYIVNNSKYNPINVLSIDAISGDSNESGNLIECFEDDSATNPDSRLLRREFFAKIAGVGLMGDEREIVQLYYYNGLTFRDISKKMNLCISTVVVKHKSALKKMQDKVYRNPEYFQEEIETIQKRV